MGSRKRFLGGLAAFVAVGASLAAVWLGFAVGPAMAGTPSPPSPSLGHYVVYGEKGVFIGADSKVTGLVGANSGAANVGGASLGMNGGVIVGGNARSGGDVDLANNDKITGQLIYPSGATLHTGSNDVIGSTLIVDPPVLLPSLPGASSVVCPTNGPDTTLANGSTFTATPNTPYGDVRVGGSSTLTFPTAGNYYFQSLQAGNGLTINSAKGVHVYVCDEVSFGSGKVLPTTLTSFDLAFEAQSSDLHNAFRATNFDWIGDVFTPNGGIHLGGSGGGATFKGTLHGQAVDLEHGVDGRSDKAFKSGAKFDDLNGNHVRDAGEPGLPDWVIHLYGTDENGGPFHATATTDANGSYAFEIPAGAYTVCEQQQDGWAQTSPTSGADCSTGDPAADNPTPGAVGYSIVLAEGADDAGNDFGNHKRERQASFSISGTKHKDNLQGVGLPGWEIRLYDMPVGTLDPQSPAVTDANGNYSFTNLPAGTYRICEVIPNATWQQVAPNPGTATCTGVGEAAKGYLVTVGPSSTGDDFANVQKPDCKEDPNRAAQITRVVDVTGKSHGPAPVYSTVGAAYAAAASSGEVIGVYTNTTENVDLGGSKALTITQCESAKVTAADNGAPVWYVHSTGKLTIVGPDSSGGTIGWLIASNGNDIKAVRAYDAKQYGVQITGSSNGVSFNSVSGSPVGVLIGGNSNDVRSGTISGNGTGVVIAGAGNTLSGSTVGPNTGDGVLLTGNNNTVKSVSATQNGAAGFRATGTGTLFDSNKSYKNTGNGFTIAGSGTKLKGNASNTGNAGSSNENGGFEYAFGVAVTNQGSNKKDNANFTAGAVGNYE